MAVIKTYLPFIDVVAIAVRTTLIYSMSSKSLLTCRSVASFALPSPSNKCFVYATYMSLYC